MRKCQQKQILELVNTLSEATTEFKRLLARKENNSVIQLLADCQDCAIQIGNYIEQIEGEGTRTVSYLEEYCRMLYQASVEINNAATDTKFVKHLHRQIIKIENSIKDELKPSRIEIVFLSYKASMGDSLESIYIAAKADPNCDAYWIPIPYYDRKPDGSFGEMYYEGTEYYGDHIEVTNWQEYDIEARHPDIIFTFNGYDSGNYVTSVHPNFYCERLRNFTDLLVYVPYFVAADDVQEHFCTIAGCIYAHKVILQSDRVRDTYIRVIKKQYGNRFGDPKDKFISLGSPKYDKVINTKRENCKLPTEWRKLIGDRKVILHNSTVGAILRGDEGYLKKIKRTLDIFRGHDDVVLWWRPHPLNEVVYQAMRPLLLDEYNQIIADYKREGWGIYDDTSDLHRAIAWMDACYGDGGSVPALCLATDKPVMIANTNILSNDARFFLSYLYADENDIWLSARNFNVLFKVNKSDWSLEFVGSFPNEKDYGLHYHVPLYARSDCDNGIIYFPPYLAQEIATYSICDSTFEKIPYKRDVNGKIGAFSGAVTHHDYTFFVPCYYPAIIRMNNATKEMLYCSDWVNPLKKLMGNVQDILFTAPLTIGTTIFLAAYGANAVVEFDMETCKSIVYEVGEKDYRYRGICFDGENYWLSPLYDTPVIKWNPQTGVIKEFSELSPDDSHTQSCFLPAIYNNGYVWLLPQTAPHAVKIDTRTNAVSIADEFEINLQEKDIKPTDLKYTFAWPTGDNIYAYSHRNGKFIVYNCTTQERKEELIRYSPEVQGLLKRYVAQQFSGDPDTLDTVYSCFLCEFEFAPLDSFIDYIAQENNISQEMAVRNRRQEIIRSSNTNVNGTAGQVIYDYVKNALSK